MAQVQLFFGTVLGIPSHIWYGALGGLGAMVITIVGPFLLSLKNANVTLHVSARAVLFVVGSILFYVIVGMLATEVLWKSGNETRDAVIYGLSGQATVGGFIQGTRQ